MPTCSRRRFLQRSLVLAGLPVASRTLQPATLAPKRAETLGRVPTVAIARCRTYDGGEVRTALATCFDQIGGVAQLVGGKTVTVKVNLTGNEFEPFMNRPVGETYVTHFATVHQLVALLFAAGARRVRIVESIGRPTPLEATLVQAGWDLNALGALGPMAYENTRNRGSAPGYAHLVVSRGRMFSSFDVNRAYEDTDVMVSLAKLKQHEVAGVTLTMKNMFGSTPNSMYGGKAGDESSMADRGAIHDPRGYVDLQLPGLRPVRRGRSWCAGAGHHRGPLRRPPGRSGDHRRHHIDHVPERAATLPDRRCDSSPRACSSLAEALWRLTRLARPSWDSTRGQRAARRRLRSAKTICCWPSEPASGRRTSGTSSFAALAWPRPSAPTPRPH